MPDHGCVDGPDACQGPSLEELLRAGTLSLERHTARERAGDDAPAVYLALAADKSSDVRAFAALMADCTDLSEAVTQQMIDMVIRLSEDADPHVRDHACHRLAEWRHIDTPAVRDALAAPAQRPRHRRAVRGAARVGLPP